jgi:hypothetical protein
MTTDNIDGSIPKETRRSSIRTATRDVEQHSDIWAPVLSGWQDNYRYLACSALRAQVAHEHHTGGYTNGHNDKKEDVDKIPSHF